MRRSLLCDRLRARFVDHWRMLVIAWPPEHRRPITSGRFSTALDKEKPAGWSTQHRQRAAKAHPRDANIQDRLGRTANPWRTPQAWLADLKGNGVKIPGSLAQASLPNLLDRPYRVVRPSGATSKLKNSLAQTKKTHIHETSESKQGAESGVYMIIKKPGLVSAAGRLGSPCSAR